MAERKFKVIFSPSAQRDLESLEVDAAIQVVRDIEPFLETSPLPLGQTRIRKLTGFRPPLYRLRSGDFRAYYRVVSGKVVVLAITHKKDSHKFLKTHQ